MKFISYDSKYIKKIVSLWNKEVAAKTFYKPFTTNSFVEKFVKNECFDPHGFKIMVDGEKVVGFGHAIVSNNEKFPGFITCVVVASKYQRQGYGSLMLTKLEEYLLSKGKKKIRLYFFNPINLEWIIPGTKNCDHPNAPGIAYNTPFYFLLLANGYNTKTQEDAFYVDVTNYKIPEDVLEREKENQKRGYYITLYDQNKHQGFKELFIDGLKNPQWYEVVEDNLKRDNPEPMLIIEKEGQILGWTGPMHNQPSGRGYFAGIGVHPSVQGLGLGKALFCHLCDESRKNGAKFMTLFTGSDNLARNIYLYAGFKIVQSFAVMEKVIRK